MKKTIYCIASILIYILAAANVNVAQAQEQSKGSPLPTCLFLSACSI